MSTDYSNIPQDQGMIHHTATVTAAQLGVINGKHILNVYLAIKTGTYVKYARAAEWGQNALRYKLERGDRVMLFGPVSFERYTARDGSSRENMQFSNPVIEKIGHVDLEQLAPKKEPTLLRGEVKVEYDHPHYDIPDFPQQIDDSYAEFEM